MSCKPILIVEGNHFNIAQCRGCKRVGLYYKNLLVGFEPKTFRSFGDAISNINFKKSSVQFPDGLPHLVVDTCHQDIQLNFTQEEFEEFKDMLLQANIILDAHQIVSRSGR